MSKLDDGGSAFPLMPPVDTTGQSAPGYPYPENGMSLRDWFAGQALGVMLVPNQIGGKKLICRLAYEYADEMLAARKEPPK